MDNTSIVLLNPSEFILPISNDVIVSGYVLAECKKDADDIVIWSQTKKKTNFKFSSRSYNTTNGNSRKVIKILIKNYQKN